MSSKTSPSFTVVVPTCNRNATLLETLHCILTQSRPPEDIVVINNGSESLGELPESPLIRVFDIIPFAGVAQARNFGASVANGSHVAFLDDDDLWENEYLEKVERFFVEEQPDALVCRLDRLEDGEVSRWKSAAGNIDIQTILTRNPGITGSSVIVSKSAFFAVSGYDPKLPPSEDKSLALDLLLNGFQVAGTDDIQTLHRVHSGVRLSNPERAREGVSQFLRKYKMQMTSAQRLRNRMVIYNYARQSEGLWWQHVAFGILRLFSRIFPPTGDAE